MKLKLLLTSLFILALSASKAQGQSRFVALDSFPAETPWSHLNFKNNPKSFQFAIVSDRTGGHRAGVFPAAMKKLNLLQPEFVMSVGDFIEGYTHQDSTLNREWEEFQGFIEQLEAPFFYLPGNHDISNEIMKNQWLSRFGRNYYAFRYNDVLFITMDTNDGDGVILGEEQLEYVKNAITTNADVSWTMIFMHHPIWNYQDLSGFDEIEALLKDRNYNVFAGHTHSYLYQERKGKNYITLATTGGGSDLRGPTFGEYDHIMWVTMDKERGPIMANISLDGIREIDLVTPESRALAEGLISTSRMSKEVLVKTDNPEEGMVTLQVKNDQEIPMFFQADLIHHHQLMVDNGTWEIEVPAKSSKYITFKYGPSPQGRKLGFGKKETDPLIIDWSLGYTQKGLEEMVLKGQTKVLPEAHSPILMAPKEIKFTHASDLKFQYPIPGRQVYFTLDGKKPNEKSQLYEKGFTISDTKEVKATVVIDGYVGSVSTQTYFKVKPEPSVKVRRAEKGLQYEYFEGKWGRLPNFDELTVIKSGIASDLRVDKIAGLHENHFAIRYNGFIKVPEEGLYSFRLRSDDGAKLIIDGEVIVDNDGSHSARTKTGYTVLEKGYHKVQIQYFEDFMGEELNVTIAGKGLEGWVPMEHLAFYKK